MSRLRSFITLLYILCSAAIPVADEDSDDEDDCEGMPLLVASTGVQVPDSPPASILAPYEGKPTPQPSPSQHLHATLPVVSHRSHTPAIVGAVFGTAIALFAFFFAVRYLARRRLAVGDFKPRFAAFRLRRTSYEKRLSDESWVSPTLPSFVSPGSPLMHDLELCQYAIPQRKLVPVTTPVCTPSDTEFGSRLECDPCSLVHVSPVRVPSPAYISPQSHSPSPSLSSSSTLSPTPSTEPLTSPARLSRLLSSTFRDTRITSRPTTAHLIQTARSYANAYRRSSATRTSLYAPPTLTSRFSGVRSRAGFYPLPTNARASVRDTFSTVTTTDSDMACMVPHVLCAVSEVEPSVFPFEDPNAGTPMGTSMGLKLRLSDASEHARYRSRERERQQTRALEKERARERVSQSSATSVGTVRAGRQRSRSLDGDEVRREFKLRDSESVLREIGW